MSKVSLEGGEAGRVLVADALRQRWVCLLCTYLKQVLADDIFVSSVTFLGKCQKVRQEFPRFETANSLLLKSLSQRISWNCNL